MQIEKRLKQLAEQNPNYSLLWAQWEFDKKLLSRALNTVSRDFPHYSLHDASHSSTIVTQIEKVIAPNIEHLSATDCWLILESCYWHDAGMLITHKDKESLLRDEGFISYLKHLSRSNGELSQHANIIIDEKKNGDIHKVLLMSNSLTFIIADYFRTKHAERSGTFVLDPTQVKIDSPRTILIPKRLFEFIASIVRCHGESREEILTLPKSNDGMDAGDYAHPRYIAALLRIGDLLDIDDGRFCPTLLSNIGDVPCSSHDHQKKHASIKHLYIDSDIIEIEAVCSGYGDFQAQQSWFEYIRDEFSYQKSIWNKIVPNSNYRPLPTIEKIDCRIDGLIALKGKVPRLSLDTKRVYEYLTGSQIYSEKYPFIRELVQNAIDATYYKIWEDILYNESINIHVDHQILRGVFNSELQAHPVSLTFTQLNDNEREILDINDAHYKLEIKDHGTGMDLLDFQKILEVGSVTSAFRSNLLNTMPAWARPSGYFGMGLQAAFKFCNKVIIKTKKINSPCYEMIVNNTKGKDFSFEIRKIEDARFAGTKITSFFDVPDAPLKIGVDKNGNEISFDPFMDDKGQAMSALFKSLVTDEFRTSKAMIEFNGEYINAISSRNFKRWESDYDIEVDYDLYVQLNDNTPPDFLFKGVPFDLKTPYKGISGEINIFSENAGYWLTIDRTKGRTDRIQNLNELYDKLIEKNLSEIRKSSPSPEETDFLFYAKYNNSINGIWKNFILNEQLISSYLFDGKSLLISDTKSNIKNINYLTVDDFVFECLGDIIKREKISFNVSFLREEKVGIRNFKIGIHEINFFPDGEQNTNIDIKIIEDMLPLMRQNPGRWVVPCFDKKFKQISLKHSLLPSNVFTAKSYNLWSDDMLVVLRDKNNLNEELDVIYEYYKNVCNRNLPKKIFVEKYKECWRRLGLI